MLKLFKPRDDARMADAFPVTALEGDAADAAFMDAMAELEQDFNSEPIVGRVEYELKRLDVKIDVLEAEDKSIEAQIAALQAESRAIKKVLKSDILKRRELMTCEGYSPEKDGAESYAAAVKEKAKRGDKAFQAKVEAAA